MVERQLKGLFYNCDDKYFQGHKCKEHKLFMVINEEVDVSLVEEIIPTNDLNLPSNPPEVKPLISLHALTGFSAPQTVKLIGLH
jgi:hypothetical protein